MNNRFFILLVFASSTHWANAQNTTTTAPVKIDFQACDLGNPPSELVLTDAEAKFVIVAEGNNKLLRMEPSPIVDGGILVGTSIKGAVMVNAKIKATGKRRSSPRFGVGLHGVSGYRLLVVPAHQELQLVKNDAVVAQVPFTWASATWTHLEFSVIQTTEGGSQMEGRAWNDSETRPATAQLVWSVAAPPGQGKASIWATPYSELPIDFDDVTVTPLP